MNNRFVTYAPDGMYYLPYEGKLRLAHIQKLQITLCNGRVTYQVTFQDNKEKVILDDIKVYQYPQDFKIGQYTRHTEELYAILKQHLCEYPVWVEWNEEIDGMSFYTYKDKDGFPVRQEVYPNIFKFPSKTGDSLLDIDTIGCYANIYDFYLWNDLTVAYKDKEVVYAGLLKKGILDDKQQKLVFSFKRLVNKMKQAGITTVYHTTYDSFSFLNGTQLSLSVNNGAGDDVQEIASSDMLKLLRLNCMPSFADLDCDSDVDRLYLE